jgi:ParB/RepB/Spo0J family partition protein
VIGLSKEVSLRETPVLEFEPSSCRAPEDNRPADRPGSQNLIDGIRANGQLVPGLVCPHPDFPDEYLILDGVGRWYACDRLGLMFRAMLLPAPVPATEQILLRFQHNVIRRNMTMDEIADDVDRYMTLRQCTQEEAARELTLSSATISRAMTAKRRIPSELKPMADAVRPSIAAMIATLPTTEAMRQAFDHATTPGRNGKLPTRDQIALYIEPLKKNPQQQTRVRTLKGAVEGRKVELSLLPEESTDSLIKFLQSLATKLGKYRDLPPDSLGFLFKS